MKQWVNAGFSRPLDDETAEKCQEVAEGIRTGPACNDHHEPLEAVVGDAADRFERSVFIVGGWDWRDEDGNLYQRRDQNLLEDPGKLHLANQCESVLAVWKQRGRRHEDCVIEIGNELDGSYWKEHLDEYHELAMACYERVRSISSAAPFVTGSTMNFDQAPFPWQKRGYEILDELCGSFTWPDDTLQGLHPYRTRHPQSEWPTWSSSAEALARLREVLRGRGLAITEMGWHSGDTFNDDEIARFTADEIQMWERFDAYGYVHYQIQDEAKPDNTGEGGFGAYTNAVDGFEAKPVAQTLQDAMERRAT